jgi:hypothetical protein
MQVKHPTNFFISYCFPRLDQGQKKDMHAASGFDLS